MLLRDPVHGLIAFDGEQGRLVARLLATREVQRLRHVRQMGLASLVFPGAEHSRFAHAVGTAHVMACLLRRLAECEDEVPPEQRCDAQSALDALAAALLHDLGHGPFSHLFEALGPRAGNHEDWTYAAIASADTEVHAALADFSAGMPERVVALLQGRYRLGYLSRALSGTLDVDRCDYLLRDSHMSGVRYGLYDLGWLLRGLSLQPTEAGARLVVEGRKGLPPVEEFFVGRHFMYQQVYHHKAVRAADALVRGMFSRLRELAEDGWQPNSRTEATMRAVARGAAVSLGDYLALDDPHMLSAIASWEQADDPVLSDFARRFIHRQLPKTLPLPDNASTGPAVDRHEVLARARDVVSRAGLRADLHVTLDVAAHAPYEEALEDSSEDVLWVHLRHRPPTRLGDASALLGSLRNQHMASTRLVFPAEHREAVLEAVAPLLDR